MSFDQSELLFHYLQVPVFNSETTSQVLIELTGDALHEEALF